MNSAWLAHRVITSSLDHEARHHAIEHGAVVVTFLRVTDEIVDGLWRVLAIQIDHDVAHRCFQRRRRSGGHGARRSDEQQRKPRTSERPAHTRPQGFSTQSATNTFVSPGLAAWRFDSQISFLPS